jgi:mRNA interferase MazF
MIACNAGDVVLVRFPFTDLSSAKQRPALVISPAAFAERHGDIVLLPLTSRPQPDDGIAIECWQQAGLLQPTWIKPLIATLAATMLTRTLGQIDRTDRPRVTHALRLLIAGPFLDPR